MCSYKVAKLFEKITCSNRKPFQVPEEPLYVLEECSCVLEELLSFLKNNYRFGNNIHKQHSCDLGHQLLFIHGNALNLNFYAFKEFEIVS